MKHQRVADHGRRRHVARGEVVRRALVAVWRNDRVSVLGRRKARLGLAQLRGWGTVARVKNRCTLTGRGRAVLRRWGVSRIEARREARAGYLGGRRKTSW